MGNEDKERPLLYKQDRGKPESFSATSAAHVLRDRAFPDMSPQRWEAVWFRYGKVLVIAQISIDCTSPTFSTPNHAFYPSNRPSIDLSYHVDVLRISERLSGTRV